jgi:hypothetical protein
LIFARLLPFQLLLTLVVCSSPTRNLVWIDLIPIYMAVPLCLIGSWCKRMVKLGHI